jgi:hypothetical protein
LGASGEMAGPEPGLRLATSLSVLGPLARTALAPRERLPSCAFALPFDRRKAMFLLGLFSMLRPPFAIPRKAAC